MLPYKFNFMGSKFFDIPFRSESSDSDFICKDGELGGWVINNDGIPFYYKELEQAPVPEIEFALVRDKLPGWHVNPDQYPAKTIIASTPSMEYWTSMGAQLLSQFRSEALHQGLFVSPFYVLGAWRTYDGVYLSPSIPVMMIPNNGIPLVATDDDVNSEEMEFKIAAAVCNLYFRMKAPEILRDYVGRIESLEIMVSESLISYDTFHAFLPSKHVSSDNYCVCLNPDTGEIKQSRVCTETLTLAWKGIMKTLSFEKEGMRDLMFYPFARIPLSEVDLAKDWGATPVDFSFINTPLSGEGIKYKTISGKLNKEIKSFPMIISGNDKEISIRTRPLKLSGAGELKKMSRLCLRGNFDPANLTVTLLGSRDMRDWFTISRRKGGNVISIPNSFFRFYQLVINGLLKKGENLQGFTIF